MDPNFRAGIGQHVFGSFALEAFWGVYNVRSLLQKPLAYFDALGFLLTIILPRPLR